jgi:hypothetical protein
MVWTQNAWKPGDVAQAAYRCLNNHVLDPVATRQCPACGVHDTISVGEKDGREQFRCARCSSAFAFPR